MFSKIKQKSSNTIFICAYLLKHWKFLYVSPLNNGNLRLIGKLQKQKFYSS